MAPSLSVSLERRLQPRAACEIATLLYLGTDIWETTAQNICAGGFGLTWDRALDPDLRLTAELYNPREGFWHRKRIRIVHATPQGNLWTLGTVFIQGFTPEQLRALLAPHPIE
jgi:hypothetical protein